MASSDIQDNINWHTETLPPATLKALDLLAGWDWLKEEDWYLAGGTALALRTGHRQSIDLDFFSPRGTFATGPLLDHFKKSNWKTAIAEKGTVYGACSMQK